MARFGVTALPGAISPIETLRLDQAIVGSFLSPASVGIYVTAGALTNLPRFIAQSVGAIAYPFVVALDHCATAWRATWRFFWVTFVISMGLAGVIAALASTLIPTFFGEAFIAAVPVAQVLLLASALSSGRRVLADGARGLGYPGLGTMAEVLSWCVILVTSPYLLLQQGIVGVAMALPVVLLLGSWLLILGLNARSREGMKRIVAQWPMTKPVQPADRSDGAFPQHRQSCCRRSVTSPPISLPARGGPDTHLGRRRGTGRSAACQNSHRRARHDDRADFFRGGSQDLHLPNCQLQQRTLHCLATSGISRDSLGVPRLLYYGGILTIAQLTFRLPLNFTLSDWLFFAALVLTVLVLFTFHRRFTFDMPILVLLGALIFGVGSLVSSLNAALPVQSVAVGARVFYIVTLWFWLGTVLLRDFGAVSTAVRLWTLIRRHHWRRGGGTARSGVT